MKKVSKILVALALFLTTVGLASAFSKKEDHAKQEARITYYYPLDDAGNITSHEPIPNPSNCTGNGAYCTLGMSTDELSEDIQNVAQAQATPEFVEVTRKP